MQQHLLKRGQDFTTQYDSAKNMAGLLHHGSYISEQQKIQRANKLEGYEMPQRAITLLPLTPPLLQAFMYSKLLIAYRTSNT